MIDYLIESDPNPDWSVSLTLKGIASRSSSLVTDTVASWSNHNGKWNKSPSRLSKANNWPKTRSDQSELEFRFEFEL